MTDKLYQNDQWTLAGGFGLEAAGDQVARMCLEVDPPFTLAVTGKWGCGKTSVMRRAFATLGGRPIQQAVPFDKDRSEVAAREWGSLKFDHLRRRPQLDWPPELAEVAKQCFCVWYSPWQHQNETNPIIPLLLEIQAQFSAWADFKDNLGQVNRCGGLAVAQLLEHLVDAAATLFAGKNIKMARGVTDAVRKGWSEVEPDLTQLSDGQRFH